jgi:ribosomal protein L7/L12
MNEMIILVVAVAVALNVAFLGKTIDDIRKRIGMLRRIEVKLDLLMKHPNIEFEPYTGLPPEVVDALQRGDKIEAIKSYRKVRARSLKEAKQFIEDVQRRAGA